MRDLEKGICVLDYDPSNKKVYIEMHTSVILTLRKVYYNIVAIFTF
jgi:hypothetical protein